MGEWAKAELTSRLEGACATADGGATSIRVTKVKSVEGHASVVASRGQVRHVYEYAVEVEWKATRAAAADAAAGTNEGDSAPTSAAPTKLCSGTLSLPEVGPSATAGVVTCHELSHAFKSDVKEASLRPAALAAIDALKVDVRERLGQFDEHFRATKRL